MELKNKTSFLRSQRLLKPLDFQEVFKAHIKIADKYFIFFIKINGLANARMGLVITKRRFKRAVDRNQIRRRLRESFRLQARELKNIDVVILAQGGIKTALKADLSASLRELWSRIAKIDLGGQDEYRLK